GVRIDREVGHDLTHCRQLIADVEEAEAQRLLHLLDDLEVRSNTGPRIEVELDHRPSPAGDADRASSKGVKVPPRDRHLQADFAVSRRWTNSAGTALPWVAMSAPAKAGSGK